MVHRARQGFVQQRTGERQFLGRAIDGAHYADALCDCQ